MTITEAADSLAKTLGARIASGAMTIGVSDDTIFVYEHSRAKHELIVHVPDTYEG